MIVFSRVLVAILGLFALMGVVQHWFRLDAVATERGMQAIGDIGRANLRADVGGLLLGIGILLLFAATRQSRSALMACIALITATLLGRFVSIVIDGFTPRVGSPMSIESIVLLILCITTWIWGKKPEGL